MSRALDATAEPRELAAALRRECERVLTGKTYVDPTWRDRVAFAAALLAVVARYEIARDCYELAGKGNEMTAMQVACAFGRMEEMKLAVLDAATAWLAAGGKLEGE